MKIRSKIFPSIALCAFLIPSQGVQAKNPGGPDGFCMAYMNSPFCVGQSPTCELCHSGAPAFNAFGAAIDLALHPGMPARTSGSPERLPSASFVSMIPSALLSIETLDSDGDGYTNLDEIMAGTFAGNAASKPRASGVCPPPVENPSYDVCNYDTAYVYQKLHLDFCGFRASFEALSQFKAMDGSTQILELDAALARCLDSDFWAGRDGFLWRMANAKIRPLQSIKSGDDAGSIPLADYYPDYHLFVYTHTDDRDVRDVLVGQYSVALQPGSEPVSKRYVKLTEAQSLSQWGQQVPESKRAGLITSDWFLMFNTMFTAVPRTTAAQAYRAFLGFEISQGEGLSGFEVSGEPIDYDSKGVTVEPCRGCHIVLDPLAYPFSRYNGLGGATTYMDSRITDLAMFSELVAQTDVENMPENGFIFGQAVSDLLQWAQVAANSEAFAKATVKDYWRRLMGETPGVADEEFQQLSKDLRDPAVHNYRVEKMLQALIKTEAYGVP